MRECARTAQRDEGMAGAVVDVLRGEVFAAHLGGGARLGGEPILVSSCESLADALVATGFSYHAQLRSLQGEVAQRLLSRARIYEHVWGEWYDGLSNTLEVHIGELRRKLEAHGPRLINTLRGRGYVFGSPV